MILHVVNAIMTTVGLIFFIKFGVMEDSVFGFVFGGFLLWTSTIPWIICIRDDLKNKK